MIQVFVEESLPQHPLYFSSKQNTGQSAAMFAKEQYFSRKSLSLLIFLIVGFHCHEKTLRKFVRDQSKMVKKPFSSDRSTSDLIWGQISDKIVRENVPTSNTFTDKQSPQTNRAMTEGDTLKSFGENTLIQSFPDILANSENVYLKSNTKNNNDGSRLIISSNKRENKVNKYNDNIDPVGHRNHRNDEFAKNHDLMLQEDNFDFHNSPHVLRNNTEVWMGPVRPRESVLSRNSLNNHGVLDLVPSVPQANSNSSSFVQAIYSYIPSNTNSQLKDDVQAISEPPEKNRQEDNDFLVQVKVVPTTNIDYNYTAKLKQIECAYTNIQNTDIDFQKKIDELDIQPSWCAKKTYWDRIFDSRYETLMRNTNWPPLKVILVPRSRVDSVWKENFEQYHSTVSKILSNVVKKLNFYGNFTFSWNEVAHLSKWWKQTNSKNRLILKKLVKEGRFEVTTGGWVEPDEATSHIFGLVHQFVEGHQWLKNNLNLMPKVAWLSKSVTHSPTILYLLSASDIKYLIFTNVHFTLEKYLAEFQISDFIWLQKWVDPNHETSVLNEALQRIGSDSVAKHAVLSHYLQFNSDNFTACGPNGNICINEFDFGKTSKNVGINVCNVKEKSELLLEQYSKTGTITPHNIIIAPIGGSYSYQQQSECDFQYNNYQKIIDYINLNKNIYKASFEFGTAQTFFDTLLKGQQKFLTAKGDLMMFADTSSGVPAYWTGYFTSRPFLKILLRRLESTLRSTEILVAFAVNYNVFEDVTTTKIFNLLIKSRDTLGRLIDRNVVSGTISATSLKYIYNQILSATKDCWYIKEIIASLLSVKRDQRSLTPKYLQMYIFRDGEITPAFRTVLPGDQLYVFNTLSHERTEVIELITTQPNLIILNHSRKDITIQINPIWRHKSQGITVSKKYFKVIFVITMSPLTMELFKIVETYDTTQHIAGIFCTQCVVDEASNVSKRFPFVIRQKEKGDIQLESHRYRLLIDENSGFLKNLVEKQTGYERNFVIKYAAFKSSHKNAGMFLFNTNTLNPFQDILMTHQKDNPIAMIIITGFLTTEITVIYGNFLKHTLRLYNFRDGPLSKIISLESKVDYDVSPKNREVELFLSIQTDISNGILPEIFTDNNGFEYSARIVNISRPIESNVFPITTMAFIQDYSRRVTILTDHAQGMTVLNEGQIALILDRRILYDDGRGTEEGLADNIATTHKHFILLETFIEPLNNLKTQLMDIHLPSLTALYLSDSLNHMMDIFMINQEDAHLCYYSYFPLIRTSLPCDVTILNFRVMFPKKIVENFVPTKNLLILHRRSFTCLIFQDNLPCDGNIAISLENIFRNLKAVYKTNLSGTGKGTMLRELSKENIAPNELIGLKVFFSI